MCSSARFMEFVKKYHFEQVFGFLLGLGIVVGMACSEPQFGMPVAAWRCLGLVLLMAIWWATEAVPLAATALLPIIAIPILGVGTIKTATAPYSHPTIYLFLGGFLLGLAMEKCNLPRRIALAVLGKVGSCPKRQIGGFMLATGFISMWVSNTATVIMMLPIAASICAVIANNNKNSEIHNFSVALMLAIAYAASIGGMATLIGTPPNALLRAFLADNYNFNIGFGQWMLLGVPMCLLLGVFIWWWLTRKQFAIENNNINEIIQHELSSLGSITRAEVMVSIVFCSAALAWIFQPLICSYLPFVDDTFIAMFFGLLLFVLPEDLQLRRFLLSWEDARDLPWGVLLLFGGGLSVAGAINNTGLAGWMADLLGFYSGIPLFMMIFILVAIVQIMTEFTSNTATTATFLPLVGIMALAQGLAPAIYAIPATLAASCAFMFPVSTPPNAIVFQSGALAVSDMIKAGFVLSLFSSLLISVLVYFLVPLIFGI